MRSKFEYIRPLSVEEAYKAKAAHGKNARFIAGGTDLLLEWRHEKVRFDHCIDLSFIPGLNTFEVNESGIRMGAMATLACLEHQQTVGSWVTCLRETVKHMGTPQLRTFATVGGNICHASPSADLSVVFLAFDSTVTAAGGAGVRELPIADFFTGVNKTSLKDDELVIEIAFPVLPEKTVCLYDRVGRTVVDIAQVNTTVLLSVDSDGIVTRARTALGAVAPVPVRSEKVEGMLIGTSIGTISDKQIEEIGRAAAEAARPISDIRASAEFRKEICSVLIRRSLRKAIQSLKGAKE